jgi:hypothetical protein
VLKRLITEGFIILVRVKYVHVPCFIFSIHVSKRRDRQKQVPVVAIDEYLHFNEMQHEFNEIVVLHILSMFVSFYLDSTRTLRTAIVCIFNVLHLA